MEFIICKGAIPVKVLFLFFSCFALKCKAASDTITSAHPITNPETIVSANKAFELGFFSPPNTTNRYVGIWFSNVRVRSVVWVANREKPLNDSSGTITISEEGNLVVLNGQKDIIWSSNVSNSMVNSSARLLDSGNLVLQDSSDGKMLWQSFQHPSDSLLKGMKLSSNQSTGEKTVLKSWRSPSDPSFGNFLLGLDLQTVAQLTVWNGSYKYWRSGPWDNQVFIGIEGVNSTYQNKVNIEYDNEGNANMSFTYADDVPLFFRLNASGTLVQMGWEEEKQDWKVLWSSLENECGVYGKCGPFGSCNSKKPQICTCLPGFEPAHGDEWKRGNFSGGCVRRSLLQCERNGTGKKDGFQKLTTMKLPDLEKLPFVPENECESQCLTDCSCTAYTYHEGIGCMIWKGNLIDLQKFDSSGTDLYIRLASSDLDNKRNKSIVIAISVSIGSIIMTMCAYLTWMGLVKHRGMEKLRKMLLFRNYAESQDNSTEVMLEITTREVKLKELSLFKFEELAVATGNFNLTNKLGQGGFGPVYNGKFPNGQDIAVKRLSRSSGQGLEEFLNEVVVISKLQHRNLVRLLGCCIEREEKMLIYEYMPNGSLDAFLFEPSKQVLEWNKRFNIIQGIGRGLLYLHRDSRLRIIHRDLKTSNILLDEELNPKISDFGMARIFGSNENQANTKRVVGTYGYMAPEYAMQGRFSEKSDVFSFGVLLIEIVSGKRNTSFYDYEQALSLLGLAWRLWNEDKILTLIDPRISYQGFENEMLRCLHIGLLCVQEFAADRPMISRVLSMLSSETVVLPSPNQPAFTERHASSRTDSSEQSQQRCSVNDVTLSVVKGR